MKSIRICCVFLIGLCLYTYSQENTVEINVNSYPFTLVNTDIVDYTDFTLVITSIDELGIKPFTITEDGGYFDLELKEKRKYFIEYVLLKKV